MKRSLTPVLIGGVFFLALLLTFSACAFDAEQNSSQPTVIPSTLSGLSPAPTVETENPQQVAASFYAHDNGTTLDEAVNRMEVQESFGKVAGKLQAELSSRETETFGGIWLQHSRSSG